MDKSGSHDKFNQISCDFRNISIECDNLPIEYDEYGVRRYNRSYENKDPLLRSYIERLVSILFNKQTQASGVRDQSR